MLKILSSLHIFWCNALELFWFDCILFFGLVGFKMPVCLGNPGVNSSHNLDGFIGRWPKWLPGRCPPSILPFGLGGFKMPVCLGNPGVNNSHKLGGDGQSDYPRGPGGFHLQFYFLAWAVSKWLCVWAALVWTVHTTKNSIALHQKICKLKHYTLIKANFKHYTFYETT